MGIISDYHIHTRRCGHATGDVEDYVNEAKRKGLEEIGFSDHLPFVTHRDSAYTMDLSELPEYHKDIEALQIKHTDLSIKIGIEADYMEGHAEEIRGLIQRYDYDFVIGSIHFIQDWAFDDPKHKDRWTHADVDQVYRRYYALLQASARSGLFDVIGHADLVKKFGYRSREDLDDLIIETARTFKDAGLCVEVNTSGLRKPVREIYPAIGALKIYRQAGVPLVFGSDAHEPGQVGADFDQASALARKAGYRDYVVFEKRKIVRRVPLD